MFDPWTKIKQAQEEMHKGPPCLQCKWWKPKIKVNDRYGFDGIELCTNPEGQFRDFSCFRPKE